MALLASPFPMISDFGTVTVIDIVLALLASFVVFPPLMVLLDTWRDKRKGDKAAEKQTEIKKQIQGAEI